MSTESPLTIDFRELSFDELKAPLAAAAPLGGAGPFVINLGASSAPLELPTEDLSSGSRAYVYRIRRNEDGRVRYRLRLGPFVREGDADDVLSRVRNFYPGALTATAWVEDLNAIAVQQAKVGMSRPRTEPVPTLRSVPHASMAGTSVEAVPMVEKIILAEAASDSGSITLHDAEPTIKAPALNGLTLVSESTAIIAAGGAEARDSSKAAESADCSAVGVSGDAYDDAPTLTMPTKVLEFPELLLLDDFPAPTQLSRPVGEGTVASPATGKAAVLDATFDALSASLSLEALLPLQVPITAAAPAAASVTRLPPPVAKPAVAARAAAPIPARHAAPPRETTLSLESTQTLRPLTSGEMHDEVALHWFVIQLSDSDHAFDPSTVPNLDIFLLYRLYSVASVDQGRPVHALRLGFFGEEMAAHAVASYLKSYYDDPTVKRVSVAERERFTENRLDARKDVGEMGQHAAIELSTERPAAKVDIGKPATFQPTAAVRAAALRQIASRPTKKERPAGVFASLPWIGRRK